MKILQESKQVVRLVPDSDHEKLCLEALWKALIRCDKDSKVLCPIGEYVSDRDEGASFSIQDQ